MLLCIEATFIFPLKNYLYFNFCYKIITNKFDLKKITTCVEI